MIGFVPQPGDVVANPQTGAKAFVISAGDSDVYVVSDMAPSGLIDGIVLLDDMDADLLRVVEPMIDVVDR